MRSALASEMLCKSGSAILMRKAWMLILSGCKGTFGDTHGGGRSDSGGGSDGEAAATDPVQVACCCHYEAASIARKKIFTAKIQRSFTSNFP
jgi:hypothetical protein